MISELEGARETATRALSLLFNPHYGFDAGIGRFQAYYPRDFERFTVLSLRHNSNFTPQLESMIELSLDTAYKLQGGEPLSPTDDQAPGKILHQWQNGWTPPERTGELFAAGWEPYVNEEGEKEIRYFGAGDTTSGAILTESSLAKAEELFYHSTKKRDARFDRIWPNIKRAFYHEVNYADIDGDGLIESIPKNPNLLRYHTERDSGFAYDLEDGSRPEPPFKHSSNNLIFLAAAREMEWMAKLAGEDNLVRESREVFERGLARYMDLFWMEEEGYLSPLVFGDQQKKAEIINDEAIDAMYYGLIDSDRALRIVYRFMQPDIMTRYGPLTRSRKSTQFAENGAESYWCGATVWPHRVAIAAEAMEGYGYTAEAKVLDRFLGNYFKEAGLTELSVVDNSGNLVPYTEDGIAKACNPQLFAVGAILARTHI